MKQKFRQIGGVILAGMMALSVFGVLAVAAAPETASAQGLLDGGIVNCGKRDGSGAETEDCTIAHLVMLVYEIVNFLISMAGLVAVLFIFWGAAQMLFSAGNPAIVQAAKSTIFNAILGLVMVLLSYLVVTYVAGLLIPGASGNPLELFRSFSPESVQ